MSDAERLERNRMRAIFKKQAEEARIRALYHPTLKQKHEELMTAQRLEREVNSETLFGHLEPIT